MKKIILVITFVFAIISLSACKSMGGCASIEKQEINNNQTHLTSAIEVST